MNSKLRLLSFAAAAGLIAGISAPAHALLQIAADVNGSTTTCFDNEASCDLDSTIGIMQLNNATFAGVEVNGSLQTSVGTTRTSGVPTLNTGSFSIINHNAVPVTITVAVGDTDFLGPVSHFDVSGSGTWQNGSAGQHVAGSTIKMEWFDDPTNTQGAGTPFSAPGNLLFTFTETATGNADSFAGSDSGLLKVPDIGNFSMTEWAQITLMPGAELVSRGQTEIKSGIPEPSTWAMMGLGFAALGYAGFRRTRKTAALSA
jgi:hypothetical protein